MEKTEQLAKLIEERKGLVSKMEAMHAAGEKRQLTPEEQAAFDALVQQVAGIDTRVTALEEAMAADPAADTTDHMQQNSAKLADIIQRGEQVIKKLEEAPVARRAVPGFVRDLDDKQARRDKDMALRGWALGKRATDAHREAAQRAGVNIGSDTWVFRRDEAVEERANTASTSSAGGYTVPAGFLAELEKKMAFYNPLRNVARVLRTDGVGDLPIPTTDDTGNTGALTAEAATTSATDITVSEVRLKAYTYRTLALCSNELLQDTGINIEAEINSLLAERIGRSEAAAFATGTGSSQPEGVVTGSSAGVTSASATAIALSDIVGLMGSLDWAYQTNAAFMMHQAIWFSILKLVDSQSRPLIADTINGNQPKLYGYPVIINNNMASTIATTNKTILFGDFSRFIIRDAGDFELRRLDELYANQYATGFLAVGRRDSKVLQSAAIKRLTQA